MVPMAALGALALVPWAVKAASQAFAVPQDEWGSAPRTFTGSANGQTGTLLVTKDEANERLVFATYYHDAALPLSAALAGTATLIALYLRSKSEAA